MARCVVIGGGLAGLAVSARLATLGHAVTVLERNASLGGAVERLEHDGFAWDAGPGHTLLPAALRDLFGSTGRPLERELDLVPIDRLREHRFADGSALTMPGGSAAAQARAIETLDVSRRGRPGGRRSPDPVRQWLDHVASYAEDWAVLRRGYVEQPWDRDHTPPEVAARLFARESLQRRLRRALSDVRLRQVAAHPFLVEGHDLRRVPAWAGLVAHLEQRFHAWTVPGGMALLAAALERRLAARGVVVHTGTAAVDVVVRTGRAVGVRTRAGDLSADVVVCAVDPRVLPALADLVRRNAPVVPAAVCHVGVGAPTPLPALSSPGPADRSPTAALARLLAGDVHEVVLHGDPVLVVRRGTGAPRDAVALSVRGRAAAGGEDLLAALARRGVDLRPDLLTRVDLSPHQLVDRWGGSPHGVVWHGRGSVRHRLGPRTPIDGLYACGAHATPAGTGAGMAMTALSAAQVAQVVGPA